MSDAFEFRFVAGALGSEYSFWLVDPPGCGLSDAPNPKTLEPKGYSPEALADRELQAVAALLQSEKPPRVLMLGHSMGGLVLLRAFSDPALRAGYSDVISRVEGLILISPANVLMSQANPSLTSRAELQGWKVGIGNGLGMVREAVAQYLAGSFYASHCLAREEVDHAVAILSHAGTREAFKAMLHEALPFDAKTRQPDFAAMTELERGYSHVSLPCQIIWGKCDQTLPVAMGYMFEHQLPHAELTVMPRCKHAPNLEQPEECARRIREADRRIQVSRHGGSSMVSAQK